MSKKIKVTKAGKGKQAPRYVRQQMQKFHKGGSLEITPPENPRRRRGKRDDDPDKQV